MYRPEGSWVAIPTPFNEDESVDYKGLFELIDFQAGNGTSALLIMGSAGETTLLSTDEKKKIITRASEHARGRIPVFFGTTCPSTKDTVKLSKYAQDAGADGVVLSVPPYLRPPQEAVYQHFLTVMKSVDIGVGLYNNPVRVGVNIDPGTISRLAAEAPNFVADKEAMPDVQQLVEVLRLTGGKVNLLCCDYPGYSIVMPTLALGGHGTANIGGNVIPREVAAMSRPWRTIEDVERTREIYLRVYPLLKILYTLSNPIVIKPALTLMGLPAGKPRRPLPELDPKKVEELRAAMQELGVFEKYGRRQ